MAAVPRQTLATDVGSLTALRAKAASDPKAALREVAKQFEALFMQELMKSMRAATLASGTLDNEGSKLGTDMLDTQMATQLTGLPGGLGDAIARQLERQMGMAPGPGPFTRPGAAPKPIDGIDAEGHTRLPGAGAAAFVRRHMAAAQAVEQRTGIAAPFMVGQAAHETGWGRREILNADGSSSHNLFGIKAGAGWNGPVAEAMTTEVVNGVAKKVSARFRAYESVEASFADYARLLSQTPRYKEALAAGGGPAAGFAASLQRAGYASDPAYAEKLTRVINATLRLQRAGA